MKSLLAALSLIFFIGVATPATLHDFQPLVDTSYPLLDFMGGAYCSSTKIAKDQFLTAAHCLANPTGGLILGKDGQIHQFTVLKSDTVNDLAIIKAPASGPIAKVTFKEPDLFSYVVAVGYPYGLGLYITDGRWMGDVSGAVPEVADKSLTSTDVAPGNSGGGIFYKVDGVWTLVAVVQIRASDSPYICIVSNPKILKEFLS